jgi:hypothetical protein
MGCAIVSARVRKRETAFLRIARRRYIGGSRNPRLKVVPWSVLAAKIQNSLASRLVSRRRHPGAPGAARRETHYMWRHTPRPRVSCVSRNAPTFLWSSECRESNLEKASLKPPDRGARTTVRAAVQVIRVTVHEQLPSTCKARTGAVRLGDTERLPTLAVVRARFVVRVLCLPLGQLGQGEAALPPKLHRELVRERDELRQHACVCYACASVDMDI